VLQTSKPFARTLLAAGALLALTLSAQATTIYTGSMTVTAGSPTQLGRLSRSTTNQPTDWSGSRGWLGVINTTTSYQYTTLDLNIAALEAGYSYGQYLQITIDSTSANTFLAGYLNTYDTSSAANWQATWLGDAGNSGNLFTNDPRSFQVTVGSGNHLLLVLNETSGTGLGLNQLAGITVEAFTDTSYTDLPAAVPEPGSWALMAAGLLAVTALKRRRAA
jgi:hypothetical protein